MQSAQQQPEGSAQAAGMLSLGRGLLLFQKVMLRSAVRCGYPPGAQWGPAHQGSHLGGAPGPRGPRSQVQASPPGPHSPLRVVAETGEQMGTCSRRALPGRMAGVFKLPHQQDTEPGACHQEPATQPAFWLSVEVDVSPKMHPSPCAPNAWASKATTKKPCPTLERIAGCWSLDLAEYVGGRCSSLGCGAAGLKSPGFGGR